MIIALAVVIMITLITLFVLHKRDILYPSIVLCIAYLISISFSMYNWELWDMADYSMKAAGLIFIGIFVFALMGIFVEMFYLLAGKKSVVGVSHDARNQLKEINVSRVLLALDCVFCVVTLLWYYFEVRRLSGNNGSWAMMMDAYRERISFNVLDAEEKMPVILRLMAKLVLVQGFFFGYALANNIVLHGFKLKELWFFPPVLAMIFQVILSSARIDMIKFVAFIFVASYILWHRKQGWNRNLSGKYIRVGAILLIIMLPVFYFLRSIVGRAGQMKIDLFYYLSYYTGGSIKNFDLYLKFPPADVNVWGKETFFGLHRLLSDYFGVGEANIRNLEFRSSHGVTLGNVYSALRRYHHDFGVLGMLILVSIFSLVIHCLYCKIKYSKTRDTDFITLLYSYIFFVVPMFPIDDLFFSSLLSFDYMARLIFLYFLYFFFIKHPLRIQFVLRSDRVTLNKQKANLPTNRP